MPKLRFSRQAEGDLLSIGGYTQRTWGSAQAVRYLSDLEECCRLLAINPELGRRYDHVRPGLRCFVKSRHAILYRLESSGVCVVRILHQRMLPERHDFEGENETIPPEG